MKETTVHTAAAAKQTLPGHLRRLEAESIEIMREVVAEFRKPVMLYSIGKDFERDAAPGDQGVLSEPAAVSAAARRHHLEVPRDDRVSRRDRAAARRSISSSTSTRRAWPRHQPDRLRLAAAHPCDEDRGAQAGARQVSVRCRLRRRAPRRGEEPRQGAHLLVPLAGHAWDPRNQRPELWNLFNTRIRPGESIRVFPLSNWTELDVWNYIMLENIPVVPLYFAKERPVVRRSGTWIMVDDERMPLEPGETPQMRLVRFRTLGCYPLTGAIESDATTLEDIVAEMRAATRLRAAGPAHRHRRSGSMEKKKREGYF